jgi:hypothetical protein
MINTTHLSAVLSYTNLPAATLGPGKSTTTPEVRSVPADTLEISSTAKKLQALFDPSKDVKIRAVEEIKQKIKYNGFPYKSDFYKYIEKLMPELM